MHNITTHFTVRPLLRLSAQIRRYPMVSYAYKAQWSLQNTPPVDWWGISNIRLYTVQITLPATTKRPHSSPEPPPTTALPQNVPMSPLMRLVALRVAAAALDGGRPWWMRQRTFTMLPLFSACVWMRKKCSRVAEPVHSLLQGSIVVVIIDDLEEPSDLVWLWTLLYNRSTCIKPTLFYVFWWMSKFSLRNYRKIMSIFVF